MTRAVYNGHEALTFSDYLDLDTGKTLRAEPGGTYDMIAAAGRVVLEVPEPWFTPVVSEELAGEIREGLDAAEHGETDDLGTFAGEAHDEDPETDIPREF